MKRVVYLSNLYLNFFRKAQVLSLLLSCSTTNHVSDVMELQCHPREQENGEESCSGGV